ncbi:disulfide bond formation protein B [Oceanicola sp. D3]|uniref:disulfide bond formation protein B n=1 Tax=Oceanicola sp. D3 TaxID=2587163 RepID=UPI00111E0A77|nr:disulfide bond formation protein B [Oceanicola sp. D3]QDC09582.1 disulfide bond formation protein B [Oceanicola sp. D3]
MLKRFSALAGLGSLAMVLGAWVFQYGFGMAPCAMCFWQRYPHWAAFGIAVLIVVLPGLHAGHRVLAWLGALAAATTAGLGVFHTGVERKWWPGPSSCTGSGLGELDGGALISPTGAAPVMCDQSAGEFLMLSMPSWNAIFSLILVAIWIRAATRRA